MEKQEHRIFTRRVPYWVCWGLLAGIAVFWIASYFLTYPIYAPEGPKAAAAQALDLPMGAFREIVSDGLEHAVLFESEGREYLIAVAESPLGSRYHAEKGHEVTDRSLTVEAGEHFRLSQFRYENQTLTYVGSQRQTEKLFYKTWWTLVAISLLIRQIVWMDRRHRRADP